MKGEISKSDYLSRLITIFLMRLSDEHHERLINCITCSYCRFDCKNLRCHDWIEELISINPLQYPCKKCSIGIENCGYCKLLIDNTINRLLLEGIWEISMHRR